MSKLYKIVLVEDNIADVKLIGLTLQGLSHEIEMLHYPNGQEFLDDFPNIYKDISLILLDLNMPKLGGKEVLQNLSQHIDWKKLPVVIFTSSSHFKDIDDCYALGANAYVIKPIEIFDFESTINTVVEFWCNTNLGALQEPSRSGY